VDGVMLLKMLKVEKYIFIFLRFLVIQVEFGKDLDLKEVVKLVIY